MTHRHYRLLPKAPFRRTWIIHTTKSRPIGTAPALTARRPSWISTRLSNSHSLPAFPISGSALVVVLSPVASRGGESLFRLGRITAQAETPDRGSSTAAVERRHKGPEIGYSVPPRSGVQVWGGLGGPTKETPMKVYAVLLTFGLAVFALSIRFAFLLAQLAGRSWS